MCRDHEKLPEFFVLTEEFCGSVCDLAKNGFTKDRIDRLWLAIHKVAISTPSSQYLNLVDGKIYELVSQNSDGVTFKREGRETPHYLGRDEFDRRFKPLTPAPALRAPE